MKILALDLDGTLTNSKKEITPRTLQTLLAAQERGTRIVLASGRPPCGQRHIASLLQLPKYNGFILAYNGGEIIDCSTDNLISSVSVPHELVPCIINRATEHHLDILSYQGEVMFSTDAQNEYVQYAARINRMEVRQADNLAEALVKPVPKFIVVGNPEALTPLETSMRQEFAQQLHIVRSEPFFLEVMPAGIDKAQRLEVLLQHIGAEREDLIAIGDGFNDESMIRYAGIGIAMGNAQERVRESADYITATNDEDGVALAVEKFIGL